MKLYELTDDYLKLMEMAEELDEETFQDTLESIEDAIEEKVEKTAFLIRNLEADVKAIKEEEKRLADRRKALEKKIENIKDYLREQLELAGIDKVKRPTITVSIQNNPPSVRVVNEELIPSHFMIPQPPKLDKKGILEKLKHGENVPGVELQQTRGLRIR